MFSIGLITIHVDLLAQLVSEDVHPLSLPCVMVTPTDCLKTTKPSHSRENRHPRTIGAIRRRLTAGKAGSAVRYQTRDLNHRERLSVSVPSAHVLTFTELLDNNLLGAELVDDLGDHACSVDQRGTDRRTTFRS